MFSKADVARCGGRGRPGCGQLVRWTTTEAGKPLAVNLAPDLEGNTAVWGDVHGVLRSRRVTKVRPLDPWEKLMMPHAATCKGPARRRRIDPPPRSTSPPPPPRPQPRAGELYDRLGVTSTAAQDDIKKAYRRLARQLHPDLNPDPAAAERFKKVTEAYDALSDPRRRSTYDVTGRTPRPR
ncbi:DnaJ domain-containing protein [Nonomuraea sp. NPDC049784]|uniref:DnaJ domain-containing protein n=1 Tax=Nonomuraea sp. NPDC049784 TaxID=3154361 RepID=UPI0033CA62D4